MPDVSIIMPCHNRGHDLVRILEAYDRQRGDDSFEIIAIDDASTDETYQVLTNYRPTRYSLRIERLESNRGPAVARNTGVEIATSPLLLIVGDDLLPDENLVRGHLVAHRYYPDEKVAILGHVCWPSDMPINTLMAHISGVGSQQFSYHYLRDGQEYDFRHFYTANISICRDFLCSLDHWFDPDFRFPAFEDAELAYRLSKRGMQIIYSTHLVGYHYHDHNIWTFSRRQRNSGMMACVLIRKHPSLHYQFRAHYYRIFHLVKRAIQHRSNRSAQAVVNLEEMACRLASFYEWTPNVLLDGLYLRLLDYFYYDGVIEGLVGMDALKTRMKSAHAEVYLVPALTSFLNDATRLNIPVPPSYNTETVIRAFSP